jgi:hypothetical protein
MKTCLMKKAQQHDAAAWVLGQGQAMTLSIGPGARVLRVSTGRLWVTKGRAEPDLLPEDSWLAPGDSLPLESGAVLVAEAWPAARFQLLVPPQACRSRRRASLVQILSAWLSSLRPRLA